jgi:hypothetical protein
MSKKKKQQIPKLDYSDVFLAQYDFHYWLPNQLDKFLNQIAKRTLEYIPDADPVTSMTARINLEKLYLQQEIESTRRSTPKPKSYESLLELLTQPEEHKLKIDIYDKRDHTRVILEARINTQFTLTTRVFEEKNQPILILESNATYATLEELTTILSKAYQFFQNKFPLISQAN